jgi:tRNA threonylcarbamoyladenosine biosynthesis protein TsaE
MTTPELELESRSVDDTLTIGRVIGRRLVPGAILALVGELGAGKTHLVKGLAAGLGVSDARVVNSPTFVLVNEYAGRMPVLHLDAYRLHAADELEALGFDEMCAAPAVVIVEWADRVSDLIPPRGIWIHMQVTGEMTRRIRIEGDVGDDALAQWLVQST